MSARSDTCPTPGYSGVGHVKGAKFVGHHSAFGCPYSQYNLSRDTQLLDRLGPVRTDTTVDSGPPPKKVKDNRSMTSALCRLTGVMKGKR